MTSVQTYEVIAEFQMESGGMPGVSRGRPPTPPLFDQTRLRKPEYWQCIKLIAPSSDANRIWRTSEALGAWCLPCHKRVRWKLGKSTGIHRHMEIHHQDLLNSSRYRAHPAPQPTASRRPFPPPLFNQVRLRKPEYWQCIKLIAPSDERKAWKASEALGSWCTLCEEEVTWTLGNIQGVKRHMMAHHPDLLENKKGDSLKEEEEEEEPMEKTESTLFTKEPKDLLRSMNKDHQKIGEAVLIKWIAETLQSFDIVENSAFQDLVQFLCNFKGEFTLPDEFKVEKSVKSLAKNLTGKMMETISRDVRYYCLCMNTQRPSRGEDVLVIELILKYLTSDFDLKSLSLEMEPTHGNFTRESIQAWLETSLQKWGLPMATLSVLTSDHDTSVIAACKTMGIAHLGCINRGLRRIASVFLSDGESMDDDEPLGKENLKEKENKELLDYELVNVEELYRSELVTEIRSLIHEVRVIAKYIRSSDKAQEKVCEFAKSMNMEVIPLSFDVRHIWSSVYDMISKFIKLKNPINAFLEYLKTPSGLAEFEWQDLPSVNLKKWSVLEGLSILLGCFYQAKSLLLHDKHPSAVYALSILRRVRGILKDTHTFYETYSGPLERRIQEFKETYGNEDFYTCISQKMDCVRSTLLDLFESHFTGYSEDIMWISVLDPRLRKMKYLSTEERENVRDRLVSEVAKLKTEIILPHQHHLKEEGDEEMSALGEADLFNPCDIFDSASAWKEDEEGRGSPSSGELSAAEKEVNNYLQDDVLVSFRKDPFEWWRERRFQFPQIAVLAVKWLAASAISSDAFEASSYSKFQSRAASKDQLMIMKNNASLNLSIDDTIKGIDCS